MQKRSRAIVGSALLFIGAVTAVGAVFAHGGGRGHDGVFGGHGFGLEPKRIERMAERLDLNDEQRNAIRGILEQARPTLQQYGGELRENRKQLWALVRADSVDPAAVQQLTDTKGDLMAKLIVQRVEVMREVRAVLTPEQRAKAEEMMQQRWHGKKGEAEQP